MIKYLVLLFACSSFAQDIVFDNPTRQLKVYEFVKNNWSKIRKTNQQDNVFVVLEFKNKHFLTKASYFSEYEEDGQNKEIKIDKKLDDFIQKIFSFSSTNIFYSKSFIESGYVFRIPLKEKDLANAIKEMSNAIANHRKENDTIGILPNSKFEATIKFGENTDGKKISGKLRYLNSEPIEIAPDLYLIFRIIKTNDIESSEAKDYFEYKMMHLEGKTSAIINEGRFLVRNHEIKISEVNSFSGNDNLADSMLKDVEDMERRKSKYENQKFAVTIAF